MPQSSSAIHIQDRHELPPLTQDAPRLQARGRPSTGLTVAVLIAADACAVAVTCAAAFWLDTARSHTGIGDLPLRVGQIVVAALAAYAVKGLYPGVLLHPAEELRRIFVGSAAIPVFLAGMESAAGSNIGHVALAAGFAWIAAAFLIPLVRVIVRRHCAQRTWWGVSAVIIGSGKRTERVLEVLDGRAGRGLKVAAWFDRPTDLSRLSEVAAESRATHAILVAPAVSVEDSGGLLLHCRKWFRHLMIVPEPGGIAGASVQGAEVSGVSGIVVRQALLSGPSRFVKRVIDLAAGVLVAICALPLMAVIYAGIRITSPGPVFYRQLRVGRNGKLFAIWKFRTMVPNADNLLQLAIHANPAFRREWDDDRKLRSDPRLTGMGRILRKTSLDELPQIWNILRGEMSFVGPRPIVESECSKYGRSLGLYQQVRPGVTGLWQVSGRNNTTYAQRVEFDTAYVQNWSVWLDLYILARTVPTVVTGEGAY